MRSLQYPVLLWIWIYFLSNHLFVSFYYLTEPLLASTIVVPICILVPLLGSSKYVFVVMDVSEYEESSHADVLVNASELVLSVVLVGLGFCKGKKKFFAAFAALSLNSNCSSFAWATSVIQLVIKSTSCRSLWCSILDSKR